MLRKLVILTSVAVSIFPVYAQEEADAIYHKALNNAAHETVDCAAYYILISEALSRADGDDEAVSKYSEASDTLLDRSFLLTREAGVLPETIPARIELALQLMNKKMANNMANLSIVMAEYHKPCDFLFGNPDERLKYWIDKAIE